jgi:hypothetical protein
MGRAHRNQYNFLRLSNAISLHWKLQDVGGFIGN